MSVVGMFMRGRSVMRSNSARSPPAMSANVAGCSFFFASSSNSSRLTSSSRGATRACTGGSHGARSRGAAGVCPLAIFEPATVPATMAPTLPSARRLLTLWSLIVSSLLSVSWGPTPTTCVSRPLVARRWLRQRSASVRHRLLYTKFAFTAVLSIDFSVARPAYAAACTSSA